MSANPPSELPAGSPPEILAAPVDFTGREHVVRNVLASWGGHLVYIAAGFIMPRLIDTRLGQEALGIWDFSWSLVSYCSLAQVGIGSSVNRYVAKYRAVGDVHGLRRTVSSVMCVQLVAALLAVGITATVAASLPALYGERLGAELGVATWVVGLLGLSIAAQLAFDSFRGVITGCHRWDLHNGISSGLYGFTVTGMMTALVAGGGLRALSVVYLCGIIVTEMVRAFVAFRICPDLRVRLAYADWAHARSLILFGGKTVVDSLSRLFLVQGSSLLVASYLGPAALAVYARPGALVRHVEILTNKYAFLLSPTASSLKTNRQTEELRRLLVDSTRVASYLVFPMLMTLATQAGPIMQVWMGPEYVQDRVMTILALGYVLPLTQRPASQMLIGLNLHGRVGWASLALAIAGLLAGTALVGGFGWGLEGAALAMAVPFMIGNGLFVMVYACRRVGVPLGSLLRASYLRPLLHTIPFLAVLLGVRAVVVDAMPSLAASAIAGVLLIFPVYWSQVFPASLRQRIRAGLPGRRSTPPSELPSATDPGLP